MVRSTTGKAGGYVKFPRTAVWPGNIATPPFAAPGGTIIFSPAPAQATVVR